MSQTAPSSEKQDDSQAVFPSNEESTEEGTVITSGQDADFTHSKSGQLVGKVLKRDGSIVAFDLDKITKAIHSAMQASEEGSQKEAAMVANKVLSELVRIKRKFRTFVPSVEGIQDVVEKELILSDYVKTAKAYILYRDKRSQERQLERRIPDDVEKKVAESSEYFDTPYQEFIFYRTYSRWRDDLGRRETWVEAVDRYIEFMRENIGEKLTEKEYEEVREGILEQRICPSMRLLWSAGKACRESNVWAYNCAYIAPTKLRDFGEIMYILMCGAGAGFTVESRNVQQLPQIKHQTGEKIDTFVVPDSKEGWADAFVHGMRTWCSGKDLDFDFSQVRSKGARLKTAGGRASGPQPLIDLIKFAKTKVFAKQGKRLSNLDVHDIICKIGEIVVSGGVRRSSLISLSDLDDQEMRDAKKGQFFNTQPQRSMANNSAVYEEKPTAQQFLDEWTALVKSGSGERGIFNRAGLEKQLPERRWKVFEKKMKDPNVDFQPGTNPCGEIILQSKQFCNLTSIVVRKGETVKEMKKNMRLATILGTYQAGLTDFGYISDEWKKNCEEEALLGVSITGYYDNETVRNDEVLDELRQVAVKTNEEYARRFGINPSTGITTVKPHGNSSQLLNTASGMHPRYAKQYIRRVRISHSDPLFKLARDSGVPAHPEVGQTEEDATTFVLEWPLKAPAGALTNNDVSALDLLAEWKRIKKNYTEHNPSITIYVSDDEWIGVANFLYENWEIVGGLSFLPRTDHVYQLAPYEEISEEEYDKLMDKLPELDFAQLWVYENQDNTEGAKQYACVSGACPI